MRELADLLERATPGAPRQSTGADAASLPKRPATAHPPVQETGNRGAVRAFVYPGGRAWTLRVTIPEHGGPPVLRFSSGGRSLDLATWPSDWAILPDEALIVLLRSVPRAGSAWVQGTPRRRWNDPPLGGPGR